MYIDEVTEALKESKFFNRLLLPNDYVICMYVAGQRLFNKDYDGDYDIVIVTGHTTDLHPNEMLMYGDKRIKWIYLSLSMFTSFKEYFKKNYLNCFDFNDLFLYSVYFVGDNTIFYSNPNYISQLTELYAVKKNASVKKFIRYCYQYNEELLNSITTDNLKPIQKYLYHFLIMSFIMNNEALSANTLVKIKNIMNTIEYGADGFNVEEKQFIDARLSLFRTLCK